MSNVQPDFWDALAELSRDNPEAVAMSLYGPPTPHDPSFADATHPITETNPHPKPKRLRIRKCGATLRVPTQAGRAEVVFICQMPNHEPGTPHTELGYVQMSDGTVREFGVSWTDEGFRSIRQHTNIKRRAHGNKKSTEEGGRSAGAGPDKPQS